MYNNEIVLYKALLMQCEKDFDLMINVRLYQEIVIPNFNLRHGQFAVVAVVRSGANKLLKKVWEAFITRRDKLISREHAKIVQNQRKFDTQLQTAQMSAGQQIDKRIDEKNTNLSDTVKSIIKNTVKQQYIKKSRLHSTIQSLKKNHLKVESNLRILLEFNNDSQLHQQAKDKDNKNP